MRTPATARTSSAGARKLGNSDYGPTVSLHRAFRAELSDLSTQIRPFRFAGPASHPRRVRCASRQSSEPESNLPLHRDVPNVLQHPLVNAAHDEVRKHRPVRLRIDPQLVPGAPLETRPVTR